MYKILLSVFLFSAIFSCGTLFTKKGKVEGAIGSKIRETCVAHQICSIRIDEVTQFDWDKMTAFSGELTYVDINHVLGKDHFKESEFGLSNTLVFTKDGEIVYTEQNFRDIEKNSNGDIYFSDIDSLNGYRIYPKNSVFEVKRDRLTDGEYYSLQCKNCVE